MDSGKDRQEKYELLITADSVQSTDERFTMSIYPLVIIISHSMHISERKMGILSSVRTAKANEEIQTRRCHVSHFRYLKSKYLPCL